MAVQTPKKSSAPLPWPALLPLGHHAGKPPISLQKMVILVGSRHNAHLHLLSRHVSKAHALILSHGGSVYIRDLASREQVYINGVAQREAWLKSGDLLKIGSFSFKYKDGPIKAKGAESDAPPHDANLVIEGSDAPLAIAEKVMLIGRRATCDVALIEASVSTAHAVIFHVGGVRYIRDLGSRTGTYVNGVKVHQQELSPGDSIRIGETTMEYALATEHDHAIAPVGGGEDNLSATQEDLDELEHLVGTAPLDMAAELRRDAESHTTDLDRELHISAPKPPKDEDLIELDISPAEMPVTPTPQPIQRAAESEHLDSIPVAEPGVMPAEIDLSKDPDVSDIPSAADTQALGLEIARPPAKPTISEQVVDAPLELEPEPDELEAEANDQVLVDRDLVQQRLSSSATGVDLGEAAQEAVEMAGEAAAVDAEVEAPLPPASPINEPAVAETPLEATWPEHVGAEEATDVTSATPTDEDSPRGGWQRMSRADESVAEAPLPVEEDELTPIDELPSIEEASIEEPPIAEAPIEEAPTEQTPVAEASVEELPLEEVPVAETPLEEFPVHELPLEETPLQEAPVEAAPAEEIAPAFEPEPVAEIEVPTAQIAEPTVAEAPDIETPIVEEAPVIETPVEPAAIEMPVVETPVVETPEIETPLEGATVEAAIAEAPIAEAPVIEPPSVEAPIAEPAQVEEKSTKRGRGRKAKAEQAPKPVLERPKGRGGRKSKKQREEELAAAAQAASVADEAAQVAGVEALAAAVVPVSTAATHLDIEPPAAVEDAGPAVVDAPAQATEPLPVEAMAQIEAPVAPFGGVERVIQAESISEVAPPPPPPIEFPASPEPVQESAAVEEAPAEPIISPEPIAEEIAAGEIPTAAEPPAPELTVEDFDESFEGKRGVEAEEPPVAPVIEETIDEAPVIEEIEEPAVNEPIAQAPVVEESVAQIMGEIHPLEEYNAPAAHEITPAPLEDTLSLETVGQLETPAGAAEPTITQAAEEIAPPVEPVQPAALEPTAEQPADENPLAEQPVAAQPEDQPNDEAQSLDLEPVEELEDISILEEDDTPAAPQTVEPPDHENLSELGDTLPVLELDAQLRPVWPDRDPDALLAIDQVDAEGLDEVELIESTEPTSESADDLIVTAEDSALAQPGDADLSDSTFAKEVQEFAATSSGDVVEEDLPEVEEYHDPEEELAAALESAAQEEPVAPKAADPAAEAASPVQPAPVAPTTPASAATMPDAGGFVLGADLSSFIGGMPLVLPDLPPPPQGFGRVQVSFAGAKAPWEQAQRPAFPMGKGLAQEMMDAASGLRDVEDMEEEVEEEPQEAEEPESILDDGAPGDEWNVAEVLDADDDFIQQQWAGAQQHAADESIESIPQPVEGAAGDEIAAGIDQAIEELPPAVEPHRPQSVEMSFEMSPQALAQLQSIEEGVADLTAEDASVETLDEASLIEAETAEPAIEEAPLEEAALDEVILDEEPAPVAEQATEIAADADAAVESLDAQDMVLEPIEPAEAIEPLESLDQVEPLDEAELLKELEGGTPAPRQEPEVQEIDQLLEVEEPPQAQTPPVTEEIAAPEQLDEIGLPEAGAVDEVEPAPQIEEINLPESDTITAEAPEAIAADTLTPSADPAADLSADELIFDDLSVEPPAAPAEAAPERPGAIDEAVAELHFDQAPQTESVVDRSPPPPLELPTPEPPPAPKTAAAPKMVLPPPPARTLRPRKSAAKAAETAGEASDQAIFGSLEHGKLSAAPFAGMAGVREVDVFSTPSDLSELSQATGPADSSIFGEQVTTGDAAAAADPLALHPRPRRGSGGGGDIGGPTNGDAPQGAAPTGGGRRSRVIVPPRMGVLGQGVAVVESDMADQPPPTRAMPYGAPQPRKNIAKRIVVLMLLMLVAMGLAVLGIMHFMHPRQTTTGELKYENIGALTKFQRDKFWADQLIKLNSAQVRLDARSNVVGRSIDPGFLAYDNVTFLQAVQETWPEDRPSTMLIRSVGTDPQDRERVFALMSAMYQESASGQDRAIALKADIAKLEKKLKEMDELRARRDTVRKLVDEAPNAEQIQKLEQQAREAENAYDQAVTAVKDAQHEVRRAEEQLVPAGAGKAAQGDKASPAAAGAGPDPQLILLQNSLEAAAAKIAAAKSAASEEADAKRKMLDHAIEQFQASAAGLMKEDPQLARYVQAVQQLQEQTHKLSGDLIEVQQQQQNRLSELKKVTEEQVQARRIELWATDKSLADLRAQLDLAQRQYNAAIDSGLPADSKDVKTALTEIKDVTARIEARKSAVGDDPIINNVTNSLAEMIKITKERVEADRQRIEKDIKDQERAFAQSDIAQKLPETQKAQAAALKAKQEAINDLRKQYAAALEKRSAESNSSLRDLESQVSTLTARIDERKHVLADQTSKTLTQQQDAQRKAVVEQKQLALKKSEEQAAAAQKVYLDTTKALSSAMARKTDVASSQQELEAINQSLAGKDEEKKVDELALQDKQNQLKTLVTLAQPTAADVRVEPGRDDRMVWSLGSVIGIAIVFGLFTVLSVAAAEARPARARRLAYNGQEYDPNYAEAGPLAIQQIGGPANIDEETEQQQSVAGPF